MASEKQNYLGEISWTLQLEAYNYLKCKDWFLMSAQGRVMVKAVWRGEKCDKKQAVPACFLSVSSLTFRNSVSLVFSAVISSNNLL